jgi:predicted nucleic acid-binding protein
LSVFIDSNIPMYVAGREHPSREPARRFLARVRAGEIESCTSTEVLQEILYRYVGLRRLDLAPQVYVRDAIHAAVMLNNGVREIASFDAGFDRIPGLRRHALS